MSNKTKTLIFKLEGCFIVENNTLNIVAFALRENENSVYKLEADSTTLDPELNLLHHHSQAMLWHKRLRYFHTRGIQ